MKKAKLILTMLLGSALLLGGCKKEKEESKPAESPAETSQSSQSSTLPPLPVGQVRVVFHDGDRIHETLEGYPGDPLRKPSNPARRGNTFRGWSETERGRVVPLPTTLPDHSMDYYAIFMVESYQLTFRDHSDFNGVYFFGDDLPTLEGDVFNAFLGWYKTGEDEDINDAFMTVPDLGYDGDEVELAANQRPHQLHIDFYLPTGYEPIESIVASNFTSTLPFLADSAVEAGHWFEGWSLIGEDGNYGRKETGAFCLETVAEAEDYMDYLETDEEGEIHLALYPVLNLKRFQIQLYGPSISNRLGELSNPGEWYTYGDALPTFADYAAAGGDTTGYKGLAGWSTETVEDGQTAANTYQIVPDLGGNGSTQQLFANLNGQSYKIHFTSGRGRYSNGQTEFTSEDYFYGNACPTFIPNDGYRFEGYYIEEDLTGSFSGAMTVPNLADTTKFEAPSDNGAYKFIPIAAALTAKFKYDWTDEKTLNLPSGLSASSDAILSGLANFHAGSTLAFGAPFVRTQSGSAITIGTDLIKVLGYHLSAIELYGTTDATSNNPYWTKITTYEVGEPAVLKGLKDDSAYAQTKLYMFKCVWEADEQVVRFAYNTSTVGYNYEMHWNYKTPKSQPAAFYRITGGGSIAWSEIVGRHGKIKAVVEIISGSNIGTRRTVTIVTRNNGEVAATWISAMPFLQEVPSGMSSLKVEKIVEIQCIYGD